MELGEPQRIIVVEPLEMPEPLRAPAKERETEPERIPEQVPA